MTTHAKYPGLAPDDKPSLDELNVHNLAVLAEALDRLATVAEEWARGSWVVSLDDVTEERP